MLHRLICHPDTPGPDIRIAAGVSLREGGDRWRFRYEVRGRLDAIVWPVPVGQPPRARDGLWRTTCFEAFGCRGGGEGYVELNFSPSGDWAAYLFASYRTRSSPAAERRIVGRGPIVAVLPSADAMVVEVLVEPVTLAGVTALGLSAVIEEADGTKSYWALAHPPGAPDFHHADGCALRIDAG